MIRIATSELWYMIVSDCVRTISPNFYCYDVRNYEDFLKYGYMGCGTRWGYLFFLSFHLIYSLIIFNLFIAMIITAFDEESKALKNAISRYQLKNINNLWKKYDPEGTGFMNYKEFWRFSSEIAVIFGVSQEDLLDINNRKNFLKDLKIPIYENSTEKIYCYKFHDVIIELCKVSVMLKYGVIEYIRRKIIFVNFQNLVWRWRKMQRQALPRKNIKKRIHQKSQKSEFCLNFLT